MNFDLIPIPTDRRVPVDSWRPPAGIRMISADDHNMEVEHLWEDRLPAQWKDKAPKLWKDKDGGWHLEAEGVTGYAGEVAREIYEKAGADKAKKILGGNAAKLWGI